MLILASVSEPFYFCSNSSCSAGWWLDKGIGQRRKVTLGAHQKGQEGRVGDSGQLERGMQHSAAQRSKEGYKYYINRSLPRCTFEWCEMPHMRGVCCIIVSREACGDVPNSLCSKPAWKAVWQRKEQFVNFLFSCVSKKQAQTTLILRQVCWSLCSHFSKIKGFPGSQQLCNQVFLLLEGVKPNWRASLMGKGMRQSPGDVKQCSSVLFLSYRFCSWDSPHTDVSPHRVPGAV